MASKKKLPARPFSAFVTIGTEAKDQTFFHLYHSYNLKLTIAFMSFNYNGIFYLLGRL